MFDKPQATHTLGLDLDAYSLKGVTLSYARGKPRFESAFEFLVEPPASPAEYVKPLYNESQKQQLDTHAHKNLVVTTLGAHEALIRPLDLKIKKEKDIDAVLAFQAEPLLPYPVENALVDKIVLSRDKEGSRLTILAARKDHLSHHIKQWNSLAIEPEDITAAPAALALFAKSFAPAENPIYTLHLGIGQSLCILTHKGKLIAAQALPRGIDSLAAALAEDSGFDMATARQQLAELQFPLQESTQSPRLNRTIDELRLDVTRTIYALTKQAKGQEIDEILVTGEGTALKGLQESLCSTLNKTILTPLDISGFAMGRQELQKFALPIGAALSALPKCQEQVNFRQHEFAYPAPWRRLKKPVAIYLVLCFGIAVALILFGKAYLSYQEADLKRQYLELLNIMNRPYADFEKEVAAKSVPPRDLGDEIPQPGSLTDEDIKTRLLMLDKELRSTPQFYPLQPNTPLVSDVLAWISTHPKAVGKPSFPGEPPPSLQIESFSYTMIKRPELTKKQEKYQVKVELEFTSPTPKMAREFHDALIEPNDIVDPKGEVKWNSNRDKYRTSFYLKDKTAYPAF